MIRGARMLAVGGLGGAPRRRRRRCPSVSLRASVEPEPLFVDLTTGPPAGTSGGRSLDFPGPNAGPATARAATRERARAPHPRRIESAEPAPTAAPSLPAVSREMVAPESSASNPLSRGQRADRGCPPTAGHGRGSRRDRATRPSGGRARRPARQAARVSLSPAQARTASEVPAEFGPYLAGFRRRIQELVVYPLAARRRGLAGRVEVEVILEPTGRVRDVAVVASSSHSLLDEAAIEAVRSLQPVPLPETLPSRPLRVRLPIVFHLR